jgi:integrase/recombinase XerD
LVNKRTVTELAELTNFSKSYISQVKNGKKPPSKKLLSILSESLIHHNRIEKNYLALFLQSRQSSGVSNGTLHFYNVKLGRFLSEVNIDKARPQDIEKFLLQFNNPGNRHAYFRAIRTIYNWRELTFSLSSPIKHMKAPRLGKLIMPSLEQNQVLSLIEKVHNARDKAIIALFPESALRLSELARIKVTDIDWENKTIKTIGKGKKEAYAPFGALSELYLKKWLAQYTPNGNIWGINKWGISIMLRRLKAKTGLPCNPHTLGRRTFACLLRKAGIDSMTIKDLGRWESLEMVKTYTRSITLQDSLKFYKSPLSPIQKVPI